METKPSTELTVKSLFAKEDVRQKFQEMLGKRATSFITSVLQIVSLSDQLSKADPMSIYQSAAMAATLDLPLNASLGFAYIVSYNNKQPDGSYKVVAQFQLGNRGIVQLALRSGQYNRINTTDVREGELIKNDRRTGDMEFKWVDDEEERNKLKVVGYLSYFRLLNGFEKTFYMTVGELTSHAKRYSQTFKKGYGLWKDDFESMALKTVNKLNLGKNGPLSVDMQKAFIADQGVINDAETDDVTYIDNKPEEITTGDKEIERVTMLIKQAKTVDDLKAIERDVPKELLNAQLDLYTVRMDELKAKS